MSSSGGAWDSSEKYVSAGNLCEGNRKGLGAYAYLLESAKWSLDLEDLYLPHAPISIATPLHSLFGSRVCPWSEILDSYVGIGSYHQSGLWNSDHEFVVWSNEAQRSAS